MHNGRAIAQLAEAIAGVREEELGMNTTRSHLQDSTIGGLLDYGYHIAKPGG